MEVHTSSEGTAHFVYFCYNVKVIVAEHTFGRLMSDITLCLFDLILMLIAIMANSLAILAYRRNVALQTPSNCLLMALSLVGILFACTAQPLFLIWKILELLENFSCVPYLGTVLLINFLGAVSFLITSFLISLERYFSVFHPLLHRNNANKPFFKIAVLLTVFVWLGFLLGAFFGQFHQVYFEVAVTVVITCLVGTTVVYIRIFHEITRRGAGHRRIASEGIPDDRRHFGRISRQKTTLVNVVFILGAMIVLYAPIGGCAIYAVLIGRDWLYMSYFVPWAYLLVFASNAVNPFLYGWKSRAMRRSIKGVMRSAFEETDV